MKTLGYYNGKFGPLEEMTVPMNDRACYFGDGVYEATLARNGKIFALKEHLDRFFNSAGLLRIEIPYTREELTAILYDMLAKIGRQRYLHLLADDPRNRHPPAPVPGKRHKAESLDLYETGKTGRFQQTPEAHRC